MSDLPPLTDRIWQAGGPALNAYCDGLTVAAVWNGDRIVRPILPHRHVVELLDDWQRHDKEVARLQRRRKGEPEPEPLDVFIRRRRPGWR